MQVLDEHGMHLKSSRWNEAVEGVLYYYVFACVRFATCNEVDGMKILLVGVCTV